jgi:hypothetical protein
VSVRRSFLLVHQMRVVAEHIPGLVAIHFVSRTYRTNPFLLILAWNPVACGAAESFPLAKWERFLPHHTYNAENLEYSMGRKADQRKLLIRMTSLL